MVKAEVGVKQNNKSGMHLLIKGVDGFSQAQGAWRFYNNEKVDIKSLNDPILKDGIDQINKVCDEYCLVAYDWSHVNYKDHNSKTDCIKIKRSNKTKATSVGYDLQGSLAISDKTGEPITPLVQNLRTENKIYSTYDDNLDVNLRHLEELSVRSQWVKENLNINKKIVDIIDREADSVAMYREYQKNNRLYLVRAQDNPTVLVPHKNNIKMKQKDLANSLPKGKIAKRGITYKNEKVNLYVNECDISIVRDATKITVKDSDENLDTKKRFKFKKTKGEAVNSRFVVVRLVNQNKEVVATWMLITNVDKSVAAKTIGTWYYYRWNIESYFKLLKSSGFNMEKWQQEKALSIFKRLLVVSSACILVWKLQHSNKKHSKEIRAFLTKLSGNLIQRGRETTAPSLLAGLLSFLQTMDLLQLYEIDKLLDIKNQLDDIMDFTL